MCGWCWGRRRISRSGTPEFAATYHRIAKRRGCKIATVAVARKLLTRAYHLLADTPTDATAGDTTNSTFVARIPRARSQTGRSPTPGRARPSGMSRPPAALELLTEQPGPGHTVMASCLVTRRRMGACETTPTTGSPGNTRPKPRSSQ
jgi:hypothetical protein